MKGKMMLMMIMCIFLVGTVSALDFDNVKDYDEETKTVTITNAFGLGKELANIKLETPLNNVVHDQGEGVYQQVALMKFNSYDTEYIGSLSNVKTYNVIRGMEEINRDIKLKYRVSLGNVSEPIYVQGNCYIEDQGEVSEREVCENVLKGYQDVEKFDWVEFTEVSEIPSHGALVGIYADVKQGDFVEWIPEDWFGERIEEWATWTAGLNDGLVYYYKMDEDTGTSVEDAVTGTYNTSFTGSAIWADGIINSGIEFSASGEYINHTVVTFGTNFSISHWVYYPAASSRVWTVFSTPDQVGIQIDDSPDQQITWELSTGAWNNGIANVTALSDTWIHFCGTYDGSSDERRFYVNGTIALSDTVASVRTGTAWLSSQRYNLGSNVTMDEFAYWNRTLTASECSDLYNGGVGIQYATPSAPIISLGTPVESYNSSITTIDFIFNVTHSSVQNVTLFIDGVANETNSSGISGGYNFTKSIAEGSHNWSVLAYGDNLSQQSVTRNLTIDLTNPVINQTYPYLVPIYHEYATNLTFNFTVIDENPHTCWFNYDGTNVTVSSCTDNTTSYNITNFDNKNLSFWANDTAGHLVHDFFNWTYLAFDYGQNWNDSSYQTSDELFIVNVSTDVSELTAQLWYNGTAQGTASTTDTNHQFSDTLNVETTLDNRTWFWEFTNTTHQANATSFYQDINNLVFTLCNATHAYEYINFTFRNETVAEENVTATIDSSTFIYSLGDISKYNESTTFSNATENLQYTFCANPDNRTLTIDIDLDYNNAISQQRSYDANRSLNTTMATQVLWLLPTADGQFVTFTVIDPSQSPISGATLVVNRTIGGVEYTIEQGTTDDSGSVTFFLNPDFSHEIVTSSPGYTSLTSNIVPSLTQYTIQLGQSTTSNYTKDYNQGMFIEYRPLFNETLNNDTSYDFQFILNSTYYTVEEFGFNLTDQSGNVINSTTLSTNGGTATVTHNTSSNSTIYMYPYYIVNSTRSEIGFQRWFIVNSLEDDYSIKRFADRMLEYLDDGIFGITSFGFAIILFMVVFIATGIMSFKFGVQNPLLVSIFAGALIITFDLMGFLSGVQVGDWDRGFPTAIVILVILAMMGRELR